LAAATKTFTRSSATAEIARVGGHDAVQGQAIARSENFLMSSSGQRYE